MGACQSLGAGRHAVPQGRERQREIVDWRAQGREYRLSVLRRVRLTGGDSGRRDRRDTRYDVDLQSTHSRHNSTTPLSGYDVAGGIAAWRLMMAVWLVVTALHSWWRGTVVERRSLTGELSLSCARPAADG